VAAEFQQHDVDATMRTMVARPHLLHLPTLTGGEGAAEVRRFYRRHFIPDLPPDVRIDLISRTVDRERLVDEFILEFTHDRVMDFLLPGIAPTGKKVSLPTIAVIGIHSGKIAYEHIYWDQASALVQVGALAPGRLPIVGAEASRRLQRATRGADRVVVPPASARD